MSSKHSPATKTPLLLGTLQMGEQGALDLTVGIVK